MKLACLIIPALCLTAGCATATNMRERSSAPPPSSGGPNWSEIDRTVERVKERERTKPRLVETERVTEEGYFAMTDEEYARALDDARAEVKKANPKMSDADVETEAMKRADEAKRRHEQTFTRRASSTYELKRP